MRLLFGGVLYLALFFSFSSLGQHNLKLLNKTFVYDAIFISQQGDTITRETVELAFKSSLWKFDKNQQELFITYNTDTLGIKSFLHPSEKKRRKYEKFEAKRKEGKKGWENWTWLEKEEVTGYILNDSVFWMHPPRGNQYRYMQASGMPQVQLNNLFIGGKWTTKLTMLMGWEEFKGNVVSDYEVIKKVNFTSHNIEVENAWQIKVEHLHSNLGSYASLLVFDSEIYGFVKFHHKYYNGSQIIVSLKEVK